MTEVFVEQSLPLPDSANNVTMENLLSESLTYL